VKPKEQMLQLNGIMNTDLSEISTALLRVLCCWTALCIISLITQQKGYEYNEISCSAVQGCFLILSVNHSFCNVEKPATAFIYHVTN